MSAIPLCASVIGAAIAAAIDLRTGLIPNVLSRGIAIGALAVAAEEGALTQALAGAVIVGGSLLSLYLLTRGRGLGLGDVKLGVAIGAGCGPTIGVLALGSAFILGGSFAAVLIATRRARRGDAIPFGPFLAAGTAAVTAPALLIA